MLFLFSVLCCFVCSVCKNIFRVFWMLFLISVFFYCDELVLSLFLTGCEDLLLSMEPWAVAKKNFQFVWRCHQLVSGFLAKGHLPRVSRQSRRSLMIRVIMKSWGLCTISWELYPHFFID